MTTSENVKILTRMFNEAMAESIHNNRNWVFLDLKKFTNQEIRLVIQKFLHKYGYGRVAIVFNPYVQTVRISVTSKYFESEE